MKEGGGDKPQYSRVYSKDPLTHLPSSHLFYPPEVSRFHVVVMGKKVETYSCSNNGKENGDLYVYIYII